MRHALLTLSLVLTACAAQAEIKPLRFAAEVYPPFVLEEKGKAAGPMADILLATCERIKAACSIELRPWRRVLSMAAAHEVDGVPFLITMPERERDFFLGEPLVASGFAVYTGEGSQLNYKAPADMAGYTIGVYGPSGVSATAQRLFGALPGTHVTMELSNEIALKKLAVGRYGAQGAVFMNQDAAAWLLRQQGIANVRMAGQAKPISYAIGLVRGRVAPDDAAAFHAALHALVEEGRVRAILDAYGLRPAPR